MTQSKLTRIQPFIDFSVYRHAHASIGFRKLFCSDITKFLLATFSILFLAGCGVKNNSESQFFLNKIANYFSSNEEAISLSEITDFTWDNVCAFYADDLNSYATRNWVNRKTGETLQTSNHAEMALVFSEKNLTVKTYIFEDSHFKINNQMSRIISVNDNGDNYGEVCFSLAEAKLKRSSGASKDFIITLKKGE